MTGMQGRGGTPAGPPAGPPWSVDVLADLHAGVFDEAESARLWPLVNADPQAREVLAALDSTLDDLHGVPDIPAPAMPPEFAARLDAAIAAEAAARPVAAPPAPVADLARARQQRNRRLGWAGGVIAVAAAVAAVVLVVGQPRGTGGQPVAAPPTGGSALSSGQLNLSAALAAVGRSDYGPLAGPGRLAACLAANGQDPNVKPAGASQITLNGRPGVLLVLTTGHTARFRLLVVGPDCAAGHPDTLANAVVGGTPTS